MEKRALDDLAICGAAPAFEQPLHVGRPNVPDPERVLGRIGAALERRWLSNDGPLVQELEQRVADATGAPHCVAVSSATMGLQLVACALTLSGEVVMPSFTFAGTAHALKWVGLEPVFCDVDPVTHTLDADSASRAVTARTSAILGVHTWGRGCDVDGLHRVAADHGLALFFDAAHAIGCDHDGRPIGTFGDAEVFSFHATKMVSAGEGGAITTRDAELADRLRLMRNFGFSTYDNVVGIGTNAKLSELNAALGNGSLEELERFAAVNRRNYAAYREHFGSIPGVRLSDHDPDGRHNFHYVVLEVDPACIRRDDLVDALHAENVLARRYFHPGCHRLAPYAATAAALPATEQLCERVLTLPTGTAVGERDIATIAAIVRVASAHGSALEEAVRHNPASGLPPGGCVRHVMSRVRSIYHRTLTPQQYVRLTYIALAALTLIVFTGAAVRLSGSGLGCPDWPKCYGKAYSPLETHAIIEYGNRVLSGFVGIAAAAAGLLAFRRRPYRRDLARIGLLLPLGVVAQAVLGGFTVKHHLAPGFVMSHFGLSMLILIASASLCWKASREPGYRPPVGDWWSVWSVRALAPIGAVTIFVGTAATASGPHAGGAGTDDVIDRLDLKGANTLDWAIKHHARIATVLGVAAVAVWILVRLRGGSEMLMRALTVLLVLLGVQGVIGMVQYELELPAEMVWAHVALASVTWLVILWAYAAAGVPGPRGPSDPEPPPAPDELASEAPRPAQTAGV